MLVVADSSPLNILVRTGLEGVLPALFGAVVIPPEVRTELAQPGTPEAVRAFIAQPPAWLAVRVAASYQIYQGLGAGESAAIALAAEVRADALLIDEKKGRRVAVDRGLRVIGTLGALELGAQRGIIDLPTAAERLRQTDFRIDPRLIEAAIQRQRRGNLPS